jgi:hypothetical protein
MSIAVGKKLSVKVKLAQRGSSVRGTVFGARGSAPVKVALLARLGGIGLKGKASATVGVGSLSAQTTTTGALVFVVKLNGKARTVLTKRGRLKVAVLVTGPLETSSATRKMFAVVMRPVSRGTLAAHTVRTR